MNSGSGSEQGKQKILIIAIVVGAVIVLAVGCLVGVVAVSGGTFLFNKSAAESVTLTAEEVITLPPPTPVPTITPEVLIEEEVPIATVEGAVDQPLPPVNEPEPTEESPGEEPPDDPDEPTYEIIEFHSYDLDLNENSDFDVAEIYWHHFGMNLSDEPVCHVEEIIARALFYELEVYMEFDLQMGEVFGYITGAAEIIRDDCGHSLDSGLVYLWGDFSGQVEPVGNKWEFSGEEGNAEVFFDQIRINCPGECNPGTAGPTTDIFAEVSEVVDMPISFEGYAEAGSDAGILAIWAGDDSSDQWMTVVHTHDAANPLPWGDWPPVP